MFPLLALSVVALGVVLERAIYFASLEWGGSSFRTRLLELVRQNKVQEAQAWLSGLKGAVANTAQAATRRWSRGRQSVEDAMISQSHRDHGPLHRYLMVLETTVTASPLIGLLGTITGMMGVFRAVSEKLAQNPQADTSSILAGIGEALIATATGILIAVVCLFFHNFFTGLAEKQMEEAQAVANDLLAEFEEARG